MNYPSAIAAARVSRPNPKSDLALNARRSRDDTVLQLRKTKQDEARWKRRGQIAPAQTTTTTTITTNNPTSNTSALNPSSSASTSAIALPLGSNDNTVSSPNQQLADIKLVTNMYAKWGADPQSVTTEELCEGTRTLRRLLSGKDAPVNEVIEAGVLPFFVELLGHENHMVIFETAWALTNIASTDRTKDVAESGAVPRLVPLLTHPLADVREQAAWCIGNVAGDCAKYRDGLLIYNNGETISGMLKNIREPETPQLLNTFTFCISNLCRGTPPPEFSLVSPFIAPLVELLAKLELCEETKNDVDHFVDICWALFYLSDNGEFRAKAVQEALAAPYCIRILSRFGEQKGVLIPALRTLGNIVSGSDDSMTDAVLRQGLLLHAYDLFNHDSRKVRKELCWLLSNIACGTKEQIQQLFTPGVPKKNYVTRICLLADDEHHDIRKEAIWTMCNIITSGTPEQLKKIAQYGGIETLGRSLNSVMGREVKLTKAVLDAFESLLALNVAENLGFEQRVEECGAFDTFEQLQQHADDEVYSKAIHLLETYYSESDDNEAEGIVPDENDASYSFGISKQLFPEDHQSSKSSMTFNFAGESKANSTSFYQQGNGMSSFR